MLLSTVQRWSDVVYLERFDHSITAGSSGEDLEGVSAIVTMLWRVEDTVGQLNLIREEAADNTGSRVEQVSSVWLAPAGCRPRREGRVRGGMPA